MPDPAIAATTAFGRTLEDLFTAAPERPQTALPGVPVLSTSMLSGAALVEVPDLTGNPLETAQQKVREYRLLPLVELVETSGTENTVKRQTPEAGSFLRPGSPVTLYVIVRPAPSPVDEVITRVREAIRQEGLAQKSDLAGLEKETDARKRFEELRSLLPKPGGPKSAP